MLQPTPTVQGRAKAFRISPCLDQSRRHGKLVVIFFSPRNAIDESRKYNNLANEAQTRAIRTRNLVKSEIVRFGFYNLYIYACSMNRELLVKIKLRLIDTLRTTSGVCSYVMKRDLSTLHYQPQKNRDE